MPLYLLRYTLLWMVVAGMPAAYGQWQQPRLAIIGPAEGLPAHVNDIAQDQDGYLYFASNEGIYRYDGRTMEFFGHDPRNALSIGSGVVHRIIADRDGRVWMTLGFGGLDLFDPVHRTFQHYTLPARPDAPYKGGHALLEDTDGTIWITGNHFHLYALDPGTGQFKVFEPDWLLPEANRFRYTPVNLLPDPNDSDVLWMGVVDYQSPGAPANHHGLVSFHKGTGVFQHHPCMGIMREFDGEGNLLGNCWGNYISRYNPRTQACDTFHYQHWAFGYPTKPLSRDILYWGGRLLVASSGGIFEWDARTGYDLLINARSKDEIFTCMFVDKDDRLWIGTSQGVQVMDRSDPYIRFFSLSTFGTNSRIYPGQLAYDSRSDFLFLAHQNDTLSRRVYSIPLEPAAAKKYAYYPLDNTVAGLGVDHRARIWIHTDGQLKWLEPATGITTPVPMTGNFTPGKMPGGWYMTSDSSGWMGMNNRGEFMWWHADTLQLHRMPLSDMPARPNLPAYDTYVSGFTFGRNNNAYIFSRDVFQLHMPTQQIRRLKLPSSMNPYEAPIRDVVEDGEGFLWISTFELIGRFQLVSDSLVARDLFTISDGLNHPFANNLEVDDAGRVWAFTYSGLHAIDPDSREVRFYGVKEGVPNPYLDPTQVLVLSGNRLATVSSNGVIVFQADSLWASGAMTATPVRIKQVRIAGQRDARDVIPANEQEIHLRYGQRIVDIEFQGLAFPTDYKLKYSYRILNLEEKWISIGANRFVTLPSLPPGRYVFQVKVGEPTSPAPVTALVISVSTPLYMRGWFLLLMTVLLVAGIYFVIRSRENRARRKEAEQADINKQMAELELKALRAQMNPHFMFNSLNAIKNYILHAKPAQAAEYLSNFAHLIRMILQHSREKTISLQNELETLELYIELEQFRFEDAFAFDCEVDADLPLERIRIPPMLLQPYVENAIWHGLMHRKAPGRLILKFTRQDGMVACMIDDNGIGREQARKLKSLSAARYKSMGMGITEDRIEIMNRMDSLGIRVTVTDKSDAAGNPTGTKVVVLVPLPEDTELY